jgi:ectoine hydroxylase-related dioxygenase (phytanoyl-CoA dioxygenase family)
VSEEQLARANDPKRRLQWDIMEPGDTAVFRLSKILDRDEVYRSIAMHPTVAETVSALLGSDAEVCTNRHNMLIAKAPRVGSAFEWHQDGFSWGHNNLVTLMVLLDEGDRENGCLQIIPGVHRGGYLANRREGNLQWSMDLQDPEVRDLVSQALPVEGEAGDGLIFHCLTPHASGPNGSERGRRSLSFAYVAERDKWMHHPEKAGIESVPLQPRA